jgi:hypothetical protein
MRLSRSPPRGAIAVMACGLPRLAVCDSSIPPLSGGRSPSKRFLHLVPQPTTRKAGARGAGGRAGRPRAAQYAATNRKARPAGAHAKMAAMATLITIATTAPRTIIPRLCHELHLTPVALNFLCNCGVSQAGCRSSSKRCTRPAHPTRCCADDAGGGPGRRGCPPRSRHASHRNLAVHLPIDPRGLRLPIRSLTEARDARRQGRRRHGSMYELSATTGGCRTTGVVAPWLESVQF